MVLFAMFLMGGMAAGLGCSGGGGSSGGTSVAPDAGSADGQIVAPSFLALVTTPGDEAVANAAIGELGVTAVNGVAAGSTPADNETWYKVQAPGYAPDYVRATGDLQDKSIFESVLTPVDSREIYKPGAETVMHDNPASPAVELTIPGDVFAEQTVFLELTRIDPLHLGPLFAPTGSGEALYPQIAFSIEAYDTDGAEADFLIGSTATVRLKDDGILGDSPVLAWFDSGSGTWEALAHDSCRRVDADTVEATLNHFSTYGGMGGNVPGGQDGGYHDARARYREAVSDWTEQGGGDTPPQEVIDALEDLAAEAETFAQARKDEVAKQRLFSVMAAAQLIGQDGVSNRMWQAAQDITRSIARELIDNPDCGRLREMLGCMAQCQVVGLDAEAQQLDAKIRDLLDICNNWQGTITYTMHMESPHPIQEDFTKYSGPATWTEFHEVVLSINPENYNITGDDLVSLIASEVVYRAPNPADCSGDAYDELKHKASPAMGDLFLTIDGSFQPGNRPVFTLNTPVRGSGSNSVSLFYSTYSRSFDGDCNLEEVGPFPVSFPYQSMLVDQQPPITLQEMLNNGNYHDHGEFEIIKGYEQVPLAGSTFGNWPLPFSTVTAQWHFVQDKPSLDEAATP